MARISENLLPLMGLNPSGDLGPFTIFRTARRGVVWFPRSPPKRPPSYFQRRQRNAWRFAAAVWSALTPAQRSLWAQAATIARLSISGYNFFIFYQTTQSRGAVRSVERHTGITLL
jgi:hypothetical protein